jgi:hypothetical protein
LQGSAGASTARTREIERLPSAVGFCHGPRCCCFGSLVLFLALLLSASAHARDSDLKVQIADPYIELRTGPGPAYPVFYVADRGQWVTILRRRAGWFKLHTESGKEGWVNRDQLERTLNELGEQTKIPEPGRSDFERRGWEASVLTGDFGGATIISLYGGYNFTPNISLELGLSQTLGEYSDSLLLTAQALAQPFPEWRASPYFKLGTGVIQTNPQATLVEEENRTDQLASVGLGVKVYITRRFFFRTEYNSYVIFQQKDDNQEIDEWKLGFGFFF